MRGRHILLLAALIWLPVAGFRPPDRQQELRVLVTARNMLEAGNPLHFEFQKTPRYRKPPMAYWAAAAGMAVTGRTDAAWAGRLPFLAAALLGLAAFLKLTHPALLASGLVLVFSYGMWFYAPLAETDILQLTGILAAFLGWRRKNGWLAGFGMAFALLSKGPGGLIIPLLVFLILAFEQRPSRKFWIPALLIPSGCAAAWLFFLWQDPVSRVALDRELSATFVTTAHQNSWGYYVYTLPLILLPGPLVIFLLNRDTDIPICDRKGQTPAKRMAWTWFAVTFVLLTLTVSKQRHYALMMLPPAAWLLGLYLAGDRPLQTLDLKRGLGLALFIGLLQIPLFLRLDDSRNARFLAAAAPQVDGADLIHVAGVNSAIFDFHLGRHVHNTDSALHALRRAQPGETVVIVQPRQHWDAGLFPLSPTLEQDDATWIRRLYRIPH